MLTIGIVGAENSHTAAIAKVLNVEKRVQGVRVTHVWGETAQYAQAAAAAGQIPHMVRAPEALIGQVDAAVVDHRHGKEHLPAARPLLEAKIPLFIDKPFCYRLAEGKCFLARAEELGVPVCSFSTLPKQAAYRAFAQKMGQLGPIQALVSTGPCDIKAKWGGVFFYGIHQVDMVLRLLGPDICWAEVHRGAGANHTATLTYRDGCVATLNLVGGAALGFHLSAIGAKGRIDAPISFDESPYLSGIRDFCAMFRTGKTDETAQTMLGPVAVLEALEKSLVKESRVRVQP